MKEKGRGTVNTAAGYSQELPTQLNQTGHTISTLQRSRHSTRYYATHNQKRHDSHPKMTRNRKSTNDWNTMTCMTFINKTNTTIDMYASAYQISEFL